MFETYAVATWNRHTDTYEIRDEIGPNLAAAQREARRVLDGWPVSERPYGVAKPVIVVRITEV